MRRTKKEKQQLLEEKRRLTEENKLMREQPIKSRYTDYHRKCGHANLKSLVEFKRHSKVIASRLPPKFLTLQKLSLFSIGVGYFLGKRAFQ